MITVNVHDAKTQLSKLLARVERGEEITIARAGKPVARLVASRPSKPRAPGRFKGRFEVSASFFEPLPEELLRAFQGERP